VKLLQERIVNAHTLEQKLGWVDALVPLILSSYEYIGGYKGQTTPEGVKAALEREARDDSYWKLTVRSGRPTSVRSYKHTPFGLKSNLGATDRSERGLEDFKHVSSADVAHRDVHSEVSGKVDKFLTKLGYGPVPKERVRKIFPEIEPDEEGNYERVISGRRLRKRMVGTPKFLQKESYTVSGGGGQRGSRGGSFASYRPNTYTIYQDGEYAGEINQIKDPRFKGRKCWQVILPGTEISGHLAQSLSDALRAVKGLQTN